MQLYTINATPVQKAKSEKENNQALQGYESYISDLLRSYEIDGFTMYPVTGYWQGEKEISFKIEIALEKDSLNKVWALCEDMKKDFNQDSVMLTNPDNSVTFI